MGKSFVVLTNQQTANGHLSTIILLRISYISRLLSLASLYVTIYSVYICKMLDSLTILAMAAEAVQRSESLELERGFTIRRPRTTDIPLLAQVERSAAQIYRTADLDSLADGATLDPYILITIANAGYLWVAVNRFDQPIGFLGGNYLSGNFHIIELSVAQDYQGHGIGSALVATMSQQVRQGGYRSITLTTFKDLPWNAPWYAKLGFAEVKVQEMGKEFEKLVESEARHGLDPKRRCVMRMVL